MNDVDATSAAAYGHWIDERVRFSDTDLVGHVNNVGIVSYVESGRVAYASGLLRPIHDAGEDRPRDAASPAGCP